MELLNTKQRVVLAEKGYRLLKQKRDALIMELFAMLGKAKDLRFELNGQMAKAFKSLALAEAYHGVIALESAALAVKQAPELDVTTRNVMGVKIPRIEGVSVSKSLLERGYGVLGSSAKIDECAQNFETALDMVVQLAETETALKRLLREIEGTKRRVNALEYVLIPDLKRTSKYITMRLDEMERERFFSLKMIKKRLEAQGAG